jgi:DNA invertase Pin-like site-specific DNA recombinase
MKTKRAQAQVEAIGGYARVSKQRQGEDVISLDLQENAIRRFAEARRLELLQIYRDVASGRGRRSIHRREGLRQAREDCRKHNAILVVWDWSRLSREVSTEQELLDLLPPPDRVVALRQEETLNDAKELARIAHAEEEAKQISTRTKTALAERKRAGKAVGNPNIRNVQVSGRDAWNRISEDIAREIADVLRTLPDWRSLKRREVADVLNQRGLLTGHGLPWTASRIRNPLTKAAELLAEDEDDTMRKHPSYGLF